MADNVELVRQLWSAFEQGGIEAVLELADPDVEWEPYGGGGEVYRGHDGLRAYMQQRADRNETTEGRLYSAFAKGDCVVARGEIRITGEHGTITMQPGWLYEFRDGKLVRFRGFPNQEAALRAAGLAPADGAATVREIWAAAQRRNPDEIAAQCTEDVRWTPYTGRRAEYVGREGVKAFYLEHFAEAQSVSITEYAFREFGNLIAYSGSLHIVKANGAITQRQIHYLFWLRDGLVCRAQSFAQRTAAMAAAEAALAAPPG
jgi:ketosteroid isomerase-like protein